MRHPGCIWRRVHNNNNDDSPGPACHVFEISLRPRPECWDRELAWSGLCLFGFNERMEQKCGRTFTPRSHFSQLFLLKFQGLQRKSTFMSQTYEKMEAWSCVEDATLGQISVTVFLFIFLTFWSVFKGRLKAQQSLYFSRKPYIKAVFAITVALVK